MVGAESRGTNLSDLGELVEVREGLARLLVPDLSKYARGRHVEPRWAPVFYNPRATLSRHLDVLALLAHVRAGERLSLVCDLLSATGVRGLRYLLESRVGEAVLNDADPRACKLMAVNAALNGLEGRAEVLNMEANVLLSQRAARGPKFDAIDIDPFGAPISFIDAALKAVRNRGLLLITATDLAPLMGAKEAACVRKYSARPMRCPFSRELAVRILLGYVCRQAARYELAIEPLLSYSLSHLVRVHVRVARGAARADESLSNLGLAYYCARCGYRSLERGYPLPRPAAECPRCSSRLSVAGPLWVGPIWDPEFVRRLECAYEEASYLHSAALSSMISQLRSESETPPLYYTVEELSKLLGTSEPSPRALVEALRAEGFAACRTHFDPKGLRTSADLDTLIYLARLSA